MEEEELGDEQPGDEGEEARDGEQRGERRLGEVRVRLAQPLELGGLEVRRDRGVHRRAHLEAREHEDAAEEHEEEAVVLRADARVEPRAVVVEDVDALVAPAAVLAPAAHAHRASTRCWLCAIAGTLDQSSPQVLCYWTRR